MSKTAAVIKLLVVVYNTRIISLFLCLTAQTISVYECNIVRKLSALYGAVVASAIMVTLFSLATIIVTVKSLSWKPQVYVSSPLF